MILIKKKELLKNFLHCLTWEDKYTYIIELGNNLSLLPISMYRSENFVNDCQSNVCVIVSIKNNGFIKFFGYSDSSIVKGLIVIIFVLFSNISLLKIIKKKFLFFFKKISLQYHLTPSRSKGIESIINIIKFKVFNFYFKF